MPKILVVDDNEQLSSMLKDVLESWGYTAMIATEGRSCLEIARLEQPDIILLDIMLPGLSGYEVCSELKRDSRTCSIAVIMMTALEDLESRIHGYKVGADNFLDTQCVVPLFRWRTGVQTVHRYAVCLPGCL